MPFSHYAHIDARNACVEARSVNEAGWLDFNVPFQHKYGYIRHERSGVENYSLTQ